MSQNLFSGVGRLNQTFTFSKNPNVKISPNFVTPNFGRFLFQIFHQNRNGNIPFTQFSPNLLSGVNTKFSHLLFVKISGYTCTYTILKLPFPSQHCINERKCGGYSPRKLIFMPGQLSDIFSANNMKYFNHNCYPPSIMMVMLLARSCPNFVTCEINQAGVTGKEASPLDSPHKRHSGALTPTMTITTIFNRRQLDVPTLVIKTQMSQTYFRITNYLQTMTQFYFGTMTQRYLAEMSQDYLQTMTQFYFGTMPQRYFAEIMQNYLQISIQFYFSTLIQCYFATLLQYHNITIQQYINATTSACSRATPLRCYNNTQHICYAVNIWQIIHESNQSLLQRDKACVAKENVSADVQSYFLPFISGSPILSVELYSNSLLAMLDTGCTKNLLSTAAISLIFPTYKKHLVPYKAPFSDVQGKHIKTEGALKNVKVYINGHEFHIDLIIFETTDLTFLLGFEFLCNFDLKLSSKGLLLPQNKCHFVHNNNDTTMLPKIPVVVAQTVHIDADSSKLIQCNLDLHNIPFSYDQLKLKHLVASSESLQPDTAFDSLNVFFQYINMPITGKINLQYTNFGPNSITLTAGDRIAFLEEMISPQPWCDKANKIYTQKHNHSHRQQYPQIINHPVFNQVYFICRMLSQHNMDRNNKQRHVDHVDRMDHVSHVDRMDHVNQVDQVNHVDHVDRVNQVDHMDHMDRNDEPKRRRSPNKSPYDNMGFRSHQIGQSKINDQNTEADVAEKLSMMEYNGEKKIPQIQDTDINVQSTEPRHIQFAKNLVYSHKRLFTAHSLDIGTFHGKPVHLNLKDGTTPEAKPQFPISPKLLPAARRLIARLIQMGIIGHSTSSWNLPIFLLSKKSGERQNPGEKDVALEQKSVHSGSVKSTDLRFIVDARVINNNLKRDYQDFPIPKTIDIIHNLFGAQYISVSSTSVTRSSRIN